MKHDYQQHPFHPQKGQPARPMRSYESIKRELEGKAKSEKKRNAKSQALRMDHEKQK